MTPLFSPSEPANTPVPSVYLTPFAPCKPQTMFLHSSDVPPNDSPSPYWQPTALLYNTSSALADETLSSTLSNADFLKKIQTCLSETATFAAEPAQESNPSSLSSSPNTEPTSSPVPTSTVMSATLAIPDAHTSSPSRPVSKWLRYNLRSLRGPRQPSHPTSSGSPGSLV